MRLRHKKGAENDILNYPICIKLEGNNALDTNMIFGNDKPISLELGMGKGKFIIELSKLNPDTNFIGIEKSATIVLKAIDNLMGISKDIINNNVEIPVPNLRFLCANIGNIDKIFIPHSIDKIYLNFSDPWPKKRHEGRRLTHQSFLSVYEKLLKPNSYLEFKTDNLALFDFSLEQIKNSNFKLLEFTYDLHNDKKMNECNIMTEYESKFSKLGNNICKLVAKI